MNSLEQIHKILQSGTKDEKKKALESLSQTDNPQMVQEVISRLDDPDIEVRGEAFSSLLLNESDISEILIRNLRHQSKNVRAYSALVLANRNSQNAIPQLIGLADDQSAMVRSCAIGALGYLKARAATSAIARCLADSNIEVKKSAIKSAIDVGITDLLKTMDVNDEDPEIRQMLRSAR